MASLSHSPSSYLNILTKNTHLIKSLSSSLFSIYSLSTSRKLEELILHYHVIQKWLGSLLPSLTCSSFLYSKRMKLFSFYINQRFQCPIPWGNFHANGIICEFIEVLVLISQVNWERSLVFYLAICWRKNIEAHMGIDLQNQLWIYWMCSLIKKIGVQLVWTVEAVRSRVGHQFLS